VPQENKMEIIGNKIELKPSEESDREKIYYWLCHSDLTSSVMGPPKYPEYPIPTFEDFCDEYALSFFNASGDGKGRVFIVFANGADIGTVGYDLLDKGMNRVILDMWMIKRIIAK